MAEKPLNKGKLQFHPSLDPSRHLSHIPPFILPSIFLARTLIIYGVKDWVKIFQIFR